MSSDVKLHLGCGKTIRPGWINVDRLNSNGVTPDVVLDVTTSPWPWGDESVDRIDADNLIEHIGWNGDGDDLLMVFLNEAWRVLSPGGVLWMRTPDFQGWPEGALRDPTHRRYFVAGSFDYWTDGHQTFRHYGRSYGYLPWRVKIERYRPNSFRVFLDVTQTPVK